MPEQRELLALGITTRPWPPASLVVSILSNRKVAPYASNVLCVPCVGVPALVLGELAAAEDGLYKALGVSGLPSVITATLLTVTFKETNSGEHDKF